MSGHDLSGTYRLTMLAPEDLAARRARYAGSPAAIVDSMILDDLRREDAGLDRIGYSTPERTKARAVALCRQEALRDAMAGEPVFSPAYGRAFQHRVAVTAGLLDVQQRMAAERDKRRQPVVIDTENARGEARRVVIAPASDRQARPEADRMPRGTDRNRRKP